MESRRRNPLRRYPTAVCISVLHFGLTQPKTRALNSPGEHPDISVVVTDIATPRLDGVAFASRVRQMHPELKVLFVSGLQRPPPQEEFLAKPFPARALVSAIHHLLEA
jgi:CheY-like chemotaxis protein